MEKRLNHRMAIIFDFGGVLLDWNPRYLYRKLFAGDEAAMERFLKEINFNAWNLQQDAGRPFAQAVAELCQQFPHYGNLICAYDLRWDESISGPIQPTIDILQALKTRAYPLYGLSNWSAEKFRQVRDKFAFLDWFEAIVISGEVKLVKPDALIFKYTLEKAQRPAQECLLIDDSLPNITVARQLGFNTIHFRSAEQLRAELGARGILNGAMT